MAVAYDICNQPLGLCWEAWPVSVVYSLTPLSSWLPLAVLTIRHTCSLSTEVLCSFSPEVSALGADLIS